MHDNKTNPSAAMRSLLGDDDYEQLYSPKTQLALALGRVKHPSQVYAGTVPDSVVARRRRRNKVARVSRRVNRVQAKAARAARHG